MKRIQKSKWNSKNSESKWRINWVLMNFFGHTLTQKFEKHNMKSLKSKTKWKKTRKAWKKICRQIGTYLNFNPPDFVVGLQTAKPLDLLSYSYFLTLNNVIWAYSTIYTLSFVRNKKARNLSLNHAFTSLKNADVIWFIFGWKIVSMQEVKCWLFDIWFFSKHTVV